MEPGNVQVTDGTNVTNITNPGFQAMITNVVSIASPTSPDFIEQMSASMSHSALNSINIIDNSNSLTSNLLSSKDLKEDIKTKNNNDKNV